MKDIKTQHHTILEVADLLLKNECSFTDEESRIKLAGWLKETNAYRDAIYTARVAFADAERKGGQRG